MGKRKSLTNAEKERIMRFLGAGENTLIIAKKLKRDKRTVDKFVQNSSERRRRSDKSKFRIIGRRQLMNLKRVASQLPLSTSKTIFSEAGINVLSKSSRCRILRKVATVKKAIKQPLMRKIHKEKRLQWARQYMKVDFTRVIFTDECRASLDGYDGWARG